MYGWVLNFRTNLAGPLTILFFTGYGIIAAFQIMQILMVDLNPGRAAASTAASNIFRCLLGAGSTAVVVPMIERMSVGWTYTFAALVWTLFSPLLIWLVRIGPKWRREKKAKADQKEQNLNDAEAGKEDKSEKDVSEEERQPRGDTVTTTPNEQQASDKKQYLSKSQQVDPSGREELAVEPGTTDKSDREE